MFPFPVQEMSEEQQSVYKMRAKQGHSDFQGRAEPTKYDSKGVPLAFKEREEQAKVMVKTEMWNSIQEMVSNLHQRRGNLLSSKLDEFTL